MKEPSSYILHALGIASIFTRAQSSPTQGSFAVGQEVNTTSGIIHGHAALNQTEVSEYLGIPFAQPPLNKLRFAAPAPYQSTASFNASKFGLSCLTHATPANYSVLTDEGYHLASTAEETLNIIAEEGIALGEDCLTLNVWTKPQTGEKAKAVLFWLHGGGFQGGTTNNLFMMGQYLADEQDVVVISANYRINVFGFPGLQPEVSGMAANAGLLDQRLAVEWARDNVAAFGGDPTRITLFGQSAGATSISMYGYAYADDPIVHGLITQSGTADSFGAAPPNSTAAWNSLSEKLGCGGGNSSADDAAALTRSVACVRSKPAAALLAASVQVPIEASALGTFAPSADNRTIFANYSALTTAGRFAQLPRLLGSNADEGGLFELDYGLQGLKLPPAFWEFFTLVIFTCPTATAAVGFAHHQQQQQQQQPVWRYSYDGDYPNTQLTVDPSVGAYHGAEIPLEFGTSTTLGIPNTPAEAAMARYLRAAWAAFAKDPHSALARPPFCWPALPSNSNVTAQIVHLGLPNATAAVFEPASQSDAQCPLVMPAYEAIGGADGLQSIVLKAAPLLQGIEDGDVAAVARALLQAAGLGGTSR